MSGTDLSGTCLLVLHLRTEICPQSTTSGCITYQGQQLVCGAELLLKESDKYLMERNITVYHCQLSRGDRAWGSLPGLLCS